MANSIAGKETIPLLQIKGTVANQRSIAGRVGIPLQSLGGNVVTAMPMAQMNITLPSLQFIAYSGAILNITLPKLQFSAQAHVDPVAQLNITLPNLQFSAHAMQETLAQLNITLPSLQFSAHGIVSGISQLNVTLPSLQFSAHALAGVVGQISITLPSLQFSATAYNQGQNTLNITLPKLQFSMRARSSDVLVLSFNTKNFAQTEYDNTYNYNSLMNFNGKLVGLKRDGIYELTGETDNNVAINWHFKTGKIDLNDGQVRKVRHVWLSYRPSGDLILTVDDGENEYEYDVESCKQIDNAVRIKLGKGIRNRYIQLELNNVSNGKTYLDKIRLFTEPIEKKR